MLASFVGLACVRLLAKITLIDSKILVPLVLCTAFAGSYAIDMSIENVVVSGVFGVLGYAMMRLDYPRLMVVVALVLGSNLERNLHQSLLMSNGSWSIFLNRTICLILLAAIVALIVTPFVRTLLRHVSRRDKALVPESQP